MVTAWETVPTSSSSEEDEVEDRYGAGPIAPSPCINNSLTRSEPAIPCYHSENGDSRKRVSGFGQSGATRRRSVRPSSWSSYSGCSPLSWGPQPSAVKYRTVQQRKLHSSIGLQRRETSQEPPGDLSSAPNKHWPGKDLNCFYCQQPGHKASVCPLCKA